MKWTGNNAPIRGAHDMSRFTWSDDIPVIGSLPLDEMTSKLREMEDVETAADLEEARNVWSSERGVLGSAEEGNEWWRFWDRPWSHTGYTLGHLALPNSNDELQPIQHASATAPDDTLKNTRIKITLDTFYVASYPGLGGTHRILLKFYTRNQVQGKSEHLHFNIFCNAREGDHASVQGIPIFLGLKVGAQGIVLGVYTVNVQDSGDEKLLGFLKSDLFKDGLKLLNAVQPATALLSSAMQHLTTYVAGRWKNAKVQELELGLDFSKVPTHYRLKEGSYIAVQMRESDQESWMWDEWIYERKNGLVVSKANTKRRIPYTGSETFGQ
jgi:hypothetical protein